jgi:hypothetical protein
MSRTAPIVAALLLAALCGVWQPFAPDLTDLAHANLSSGGPICSAPTISAAT